MGWPAPGLGLSVGAAIKQDRAQAGVGQRGRSRCAGRTCADNHGVGDAGAAVIHSVLASLSGQDSMAQFHLLDVEFLPGTRLLPCQDDRVRYTAFEQMLKRIS